MSVTSRSHRSRRGQMLIGLIIVIAIILAMTAWSLRPNGVEQSAMHKGDMTACTIYTSQIREAIMMYKQDNGHYPPDLASLKKQGVTPEMYTAPCVFGYDPSTGALTPPSGAPGQAAAPAPTPAAAPITSSFPMSRPASAPASGGGGGGSTYIPPMAGTVGVHVPNSSPAPQSGGDNN